MVCRDSTMASSDSSRGSKLGSRCPNEYGGDSLDSSYNRSFRPDRLSDRRRDSDERYRDRDRDRRHRSRSRDRNDRHSRSYRDYDDRRKEESRSRSNDRHKSSRSSHRDDRSDKYSKNKRTDSKERDRDKYSSNKYSESTRYDSKSSDDDNASAHNDDDYEEEEEETVEETKPVVQNAFQNDGSFLEMFKKMQEAKNLAAQEAAQQFVESTESTSSVTSRPSTSVVGKRRGGRILPTGVVRKQKQDEEEVEVKKPNDAWSVYMAEVRKYRQATCDEDRTTRPLVK